MPVFIVLNSVFETKIFLIFHYCHFFCIFAKRKLSNSIN